jgi:hypothetical protein
MQAKTQRPSDRRIGLLHAPEARDVGERGRVGLKPRGRTLPTTDQHTGGAGRARRDGRQARPEAESPEPLSLSLGEMRAARDERERRLKGQAAEAAQREQEHRAGDRRRF